MKDLNIFCSLFSDLDFVMKMEMKYDRGGAVCGLVKRVTDVGVNDIMPLGAAIFDVPDVNESVLVRLQVARATTPTRLRLHLQVFQPTNQISGFTDDAGLFHEWPLFALFDPSAHLFLQLLKLIFDLGEILGVGGVVSELLYEGGFGVGEIYIGLVAAAVHAA